MCEMEILIQQTRMKLIYDSQRLMHQLECTYDHRIDMLLRQKREITLQIQRSVREKLEFLMAKSIEMQQKSVKSPNAHPPPQQKNNRRSSAADTNPVIDQKADTKQSSCDSVTISEDTPSTKPSPKLKRKKARKRKRNEMNGENRKNDRNNNRNVRARSEANNSGDTVVENKEGGSKQDDEKSVDIHARYVGRDLQCKQCHKSFVFQSQFKKHMLTVHDQKQSYECHLCDHRFVCREGMMAHYVRVHGYRGRYQCGVCNESFWHHSRWTKHQHACEEVKGKECKEGKSKSVVMLMYDCKICSAKFLKYKELTRHVSAAHHKEKPFKCDECGHRFSNKSLLKKHGYICWE